jgi:hypothetical protein
MSGIDCGFILETTCGLLPVTASFPHPSLPAPHLKDRRESLPVQGGDSGESPLCEAVSFYFMSIIFWTAEKSPETIRTKYTPLGTIVPCSSVPFQVTL